MSLKRCWRWLVPLGIVCLTVGTAPACTSFVLDHTDGRMLAANLDWPTGEGIVVVNKRGFFKKAVTDPAGPYEPARWTSRYGSVTFNIYGIDWPWGGMNEAGLAGVALMLPQAQYPPPGRQPSIFVLQWLQYQLDNFATVHAVLDQVAKLPIRPTSRGKGTHFFLCDRSGDAAIVEFIDGRLLVYHGERLPVPVMANDPYGASLAYLKRFVGFGGDLPIQKSNLAQDRFVRAADGIAAFWKVDPMAPVEAACDILDRVAYRSHRRTFTQWQVVFDIHNDRIYYRTRRHRHRREIDMAGFDFNCADAIRMRDIDSDDGPTANGFEAYTYDRNRMRVEAFFRPHPLKPKEYEARVDRITRYPDSFECR